MFEVVCYLAERAYKKSSFSKPKRNERYTEEEDYGEDYVRVPYVAYRIEKRRPYDIMIRSFARVDLEKSVQLALEVSRLLTFARSTGLIFEPIHIRFVGKAGQCKTQYALHVMKLIDRCGLIGINRTANDNYFDDLVKMVKHKKGKRNDYGYLYHPHVEDRDLTDLDAIFLDEVNARKVDDPGMQIIMEGVTPMMWKPLMANPSYKGRTYKPVLWFSTANHEITRHEYCIPAVLRRTHHRFIVDGGRLYRQNCYKIRDAEGLFQGGFETCHGLFGRWTDSIMSTSRTESVDVEGRLAQSHNTSTSNSTVCRIEDTFSLKEFKCSHCVEVSFSQFLELILGYVIERLNSSVRTHELVESKMCPNPSTIVRAANVVVAESDVSLT
jgi:hypothetical protein